MVVLVGCSGDDRNTLVVDELGELDNGEVTVGGAAAPPETLPLDDPPSAEELDVAFDADARPYDVAAGWWDGAEATEQSLGRLAAPDGELRVIDGISLGLDPRFEADGATDVSFGERVGEVELTLIRSHDVSAPASELGATVGVRLDVPGADPVERWTPFEYAYGTDGGLGGITTPVILDGAAVVAELEDGDSFLGEWWAGSDPDYYLGAHATDDGTPDVFVYFNGFGDGAFPLSRGLSAGGDVVAVVLPTLTYPWRLMVPDGVPPDDVTRAEDELAECLTGKRTVIVHRSDDGSEYLACSSDP